MKLFTLVETPLFTKHITSFNLISSPIQRLDVIAGLRGLRKLRWQASGKGKRGGARFIYLHVPEGEVIYLFAVYTKGDITDLNSDQRKRLLTAVETIKSSF